MKDKLKKDSEDSCVKPIHNVSFNKTIEQCLIEAEGKLGLNLERLYCKLDKRPCVYRKSTQFDIDRVLSLAEELFNNQ